MIPKFPDAIERFRQACEADSVVLAAFLGGSFASGTADEASDLDLYVVTREPDYPEFFRRREAFVCSWGDPVFLDDTLNFEGFGFDMVHFVLRDGVCGELALGHTGNFMSLHGGPHEVLVDKVGLLSGVTFPLYEPPQDERRKAAARALGWFWLDVIALAKHVRRGRLLAAQSRLASLRHHCLTLLEATEPADTAVRERIANTFCRLERDEIVAAGAELISIHKELGPALAAAMGLEYPARLAAVAEAKSRDAVS